MPADRSPRAGARAGAAGGDWRRELASLTPGDGSGVPGTTDEQATDAAARRPLALQFELRRRVPRRRGEWQGPRDEPARRATSVDRLAVRPVTTGARGGWIKARAHLAEHRLPGERGRVRPRAVALVRAVRAAEGQHARGLPGLRLGVDHPRRVREPAALGAARRGGASRHRARRVGCHARGARARAGVGRARREPRRRRRPRARATARVRRRSGRLDGRRTRRPRRRRRRRPRRSVGSAPPSTCGPSPTTASTGSTSTRARSSSSRSRPR